MRYGDMRVKVRELMKARGFVGILQEAIVTLGALLVIGLVSGIVSFVISLPFNILNYLIDSELISALIVALRTLFSSLAMIVVYGCLSVGLAKMYKEFVVTGRLSISNMFSISVEEIPRIAITMFLVGLKTFLLSCLCFVPGIIYSYKVVLVPWILSDNNGMPPSEIIATSKQMMDGYKVEYFVQCGLMLLPYVFAGSLLSGCTFGLSMCLATMYMYSVQAIFYLLRREQFNGGLH